MDGCCWDTGKADKKDWRASIKLTMDTTANIRKIALGRPVFDREEAEATAKIFNAQWVLNGPEVRRFEEEFKKYIGSSQATAVNSCTAAMHLALASLGLKAGDEVLLPSFNFIAAGLAVCQARLKPVFVEVNPRTGNLDTGKLKKMVAKSTKVKAIQVLHYAEYPPDLDSVLQIARKHVQRVTEDTAQAMGTGYAGKKIGVHTDAACFSFGPLKMICSGGMGGMVTSDHKDLVEKINSLRSYGMDKSMWDRRESQRPWIYSVTELGHNFRMSDFQAAAGIVQMKKLDQFIARRKKIASFYDQALSRQSRIDMFHPESKSEPVPLYYVIKILDKTGSLRDKLALFLIEHGIGASVHWDPPLHLHPLFRCYGYAPGDFPLTEELSKMTLSLPLHPGMSDEDAEYIVGKIDEFFQQGL
ncbi:MAG: DegT/DnrJ/EryC1/StrS family aminotransferase [Candidatus Omnitrophica bacterium]|nr:DegT/DnrJ/EryC1/StrS family aminotransferase [Candidatus Omnitrophota bacterium]